MAGEKSADVDIVNRLRESIGLLTKVGRQAREQKAALAEILRLRAVVDGRSADGNSPKTQKEPDDDDPVDEDIADRLRRSIEWLNRCCYEGRDEKAGLAEILRLRAIVEARRIAVEDWALG